MQVYEKTIEIPSVHYIPPKVGDGDNDFDGNGPKVSASAELQIRNGIELWIRVAMHAKETKKDYSEADGSDDRRLYTVDDPRHQVIEAIVSDPKTEHEYTDSDHDDGPFRVSEAELVNEFVFVGDTKGNEVASRTGMRLRFNPVVIRIRDSRP